eukprot:CAMPEP_0197027888 /NCGR_PEP_ID=MMETSP1384-20130603/7745_1 /TAXON_ID=29189 /ORGANISM="Ammonia sp." /LENGTH=475 /DNA_ID=CAMNT_0042456807 /DNA_START=13 /DNA_END=1437 /DNA_ORIENTATION=-
MAASLGSSNWTPSINDTSEIFGVILIFIPYLIMLLPRHIQKKVTVQLQRLYLHHTPRNDWNNAVGDAPPRRLMGYLCSLLFIFIGIILLLIKNHVNNYWVDFIQYFVFISLPLLCAIIRPSSKQPCDVFDLLIILLVIVPIEISQEYDAFLPDIKFKIYNSWQSSPDISILRVTGFNLFLFIFLVFRPLTCIGLSWQIRNWFICKLNLFRALIVLVIFLVIAIPFCLIPNIDYLHKPESAHNVWIDGIARFFCLFFFNNLIYEFLYRGILQNLMHSAADFRHEARSYLHGNDESLTDILNQFQEDSFDVASSPPRDPSEILWNSQPPAASSSNDKTAPLLVDPTTSINGHGSSSAHNVQRKKSKSKSKSRRKQHPDHVVLDAKALPYYENDEDDEDDLTESQLFNADLDVSMISYQQKQRELQKQAKCCYVVRFRYLRDWFIVIAASLIYAFTIIDYRNYGSTADLIYAAIFMFW